MARIFNNQEACSSSSYISNDAKFSNVTVLNSLKIPIVTDTLPSGQDGLLVFNERTSCLMIKCKNMWKSLPMKCVSLNTNTTGPKLTVDKNDLIVEYETVEDEHLIEQIENFISDSKIKGLKKIKILFPKSKEKIHKVRMDMLTMNFDKKLKVHNNFWCEIDL